jgi:hypothetical protein
MLSPSARRIFAALTTMTVAAVATLALGTAPAHAAPSGYLLTKGTGSVYSKSDLVGLSVVPGNRGATFSYKIVNTADLPTQFKVELSYSGDSANYLIAELHQGSTRVPGKFYTPLIAPGGSFALTVKAYLEPATPQTQLPTFKIDLKDPETNAQLDSALGAAVVPAPTSGTKSNDLFIKTGTQPFVGGSVSNQLISASAIKPGNTAAFVLRLKNDGTAPATIGLTGGGALACPQLTLTVRQGTQNVTAAVKAGAYNTGNLAPGAKKELTVQVKLTTATGCQSEFIRFIASVPGVASVTNSAHVLIGV